VAAGEGIFLSSRNAVSGRHAVFEDDGASAWLYLTEAGGQRPERDVFVYSPIAPVAKESAMAEAKAGKPPPLAADYAASNAPFASPSAASLSFLWSADGEAVSLLHAGEPIAMIAAEWKQGCSKAVSRPGPYGLPWDEALYRAQFGPQAG
jgi:hypothetical protein